MRHLTALLALTLFGSAAGAQTTEDLVRELIRKQQTMSIPEYQNHVREQLREREEKGREPYVIYQPPLQPVPELPFPYNYSSVMRDVYNPYVPPGRRLGE